MVIAATSASVDETAGESVSSPHRSPEELVVKAIAPVKPEYLRPPPVRSGDTRRSGGDNTGDEVSKDKTGDSAGSGLVKEKKSKRQQKKERQQKPADLEGMCPFDSEEKICPYGITCRFFGTHKKNLIRESQDLQRRKSHEINNLDKDLQKSLWKGKVKFPKAEAQVKLLGLKSGKKASLETEVEQEEINEECVEDGDKPEEESRPLKRSKSEGDTDCTNETSNGSHLLFIFINDDSLFNSACVVSTQPVPSQEKGGGFVIGLASQQ